MKITKKICFIACFVALFLVLDKVSILIPGINVRITARNLPLYIGAYLFGPVSGGLIGFFGMLIGQLNHPDNTIEIIVCILFLIPQTTIGIFTGILSNKKILNFENNNIFNYLYIIILNLTLSIINTVCIFLMDMHLFHNLNTAYAHLALQVPFRLLNSIFTAIVYSLIIPYIFKVFRFIK